MSAPKRYGSRRGFVILFFSILVPMTWRLLVTEWERLDTGFPPTNYCFRLKHQSAAGSHYLFPPGWRRQGTCPASCLSSGNLILGTLPAQQEASTRLEYRKTERPGVHLRTNRVHYLGSEAGSSNHNSYGSSTKCTRLSLLDRGTARGRISCIPTGTFNPYDPPLQHERLTLCAGTNPGELNQSGTVPG